jgi:LEA14-like dessication related protein
MNSAEVKSINYVSMHGAPSSQEIVTKLKSLDREQSLKIRMKCGDLTSAAFCQALHSTVDYVEVNLIDYVSMHVTPSSQEIVTKLKPLDREQSMKIKCGDLTSAAFCQALHSTMNSVEVNSIDYVSMHVTPSSQEIVTRSKSLDPEQSIKIRMKCGHLTSA